MYSIKKRYKTGFRAWASYWLTQIGKAVFAFVVMALWFFVIIGFRSPTLYRNAADYSPGKEILTIILPILSMNNL